MSAEPTLAERIVLERERRLRDQPWHYWVRSGRDQPPVNEYWCDHCAGYFGVPHSYIHEAGFCPTMAMGMQCACIDCWVFDGRVERRCGDPVPARVGLSDDHETAVE